MKTIRTTCPYCGVGCGVLASVDDAGQVSVRGDDQHPANLGRLCVKGAALGETTGLAGRLLTPEVDGQQVAWPQALAETAARLRQIIDQHGPQAVAFYASGQLLTEDYYAANKLMKGFIGAANIDTNSRLCMASSVAGHKRAFGTDTVPGTYADLDEADLIGGDIGGRQCFVDGQSQSQAVGPRLGKVVGVGGAAVTQDVSQWIDLP